jgi:hypothetical protein
LNFLLRRFSGCLLLSASIIAPYTSAASTNSMPMSASLRQQLAVALAERSKLQREIALIKRDTELTWAAERVESALFRERINDVAYEVVRIIRSLETPGSSIGPISANAALVIEHGSRTQSLNINGASGEASATTTHMGALAERIHALRTTASRVAAN